MELDRLFETYSNLYPKDAEALSIIKKYIINELSENGYHYDNVEDIIRDMSADPGLLFGEVSQLNEKWCDKYAEFCAILHKSIHEW